MTQIVQAPSLRAGQKAAILEKRLGKFYGCTTTFRRAVLMDNEKLIIGAIALVAIVLLAPFIHSRFFDQHRYDPVADSHKLEELRDAITAYGQQTGQYPPSLFHLVPDYIDEIPLTSTNQQFEYDPTNGNLVNPGAPIEKAPEDDKNARNGGRSRGGSGVSAGTDAITGVGVAQELNY